MTHQTAPLLSRRASPLARAGVGLLSGLLVGQMQVAQLPQGTTISWLPAAHAQAAANSTLAVLVVPVQRKNADDAEALERLLSDATQRLDNVRLYDLSPVPGVEAGQKAHELVEEGLRALLLRTPKRAQERLAAALQLLTENPMAGDERLFARLYKGQGLANLANNEVVRARDAMVRSMVIFPAQTAAEYAAYGSTARELFDNVKQVVTAAPTGDLKVAIKGGKADIWIDGVYRGNGLATATDIPVGTHRITVKASGQVAERRFVEVAADKPNAVEIELKPAPFANDLDQGRNVLIANFTQPSVVEDRIRELRNQLGADQMIVVRPKLNKKNTELTGYFLGADGTFKKIDLVLEKDERYLDKLAEFLATTVGSKLMPDPNTQPLDLRQSVVAQNTGPKAGAAATVASDMFKEEESTEEPVTKKWWFWTAVLGGAALVGGGLYLLGANPPPPTPGATGTLKFGLNKVAGN